MTKKKKKPKLNPDDSSPSGSSSFASSGSQDSTQGSLDLAADSTSDLRIPVFPGTSAPPEKSSEPIVEPIGAVTTTIPDSAQGNPNSEIQGAVIATTEPAQGNPNTDNQGAVTATNTAVDQGNSSTEDQDAVTAILKEGEFVPPSSSKPTTEHPVPAEIAVDLAHPVQTRTKENNTKPVPQSPAEHWRKFVKSKSKKLEPEGTPFTLDSGEACIWIPNSVIEKNKKAWDSFIIGQFYEESPARGAVHAIVNGI